MAGDDSQVAAAEQFRRAPGNVAVAGAVESPAAHQSVRRPIVGDGVEAVAVGDGRVERGLEAGNQGDLRQFLLQ